MYEQTIDDKNCRTDEVYHPKSDKRFHSDRDDYQDRGDVADEFV